MLSLTKVKKAVSSLANTLSTQEQWHPALCILAAVSACLVCFGPEGSRAFYLGSVVYCAAQLSAVLVKKVQRSTLAKFLVGMVEFTVVLYNPLSLADPSRLGMIARELPAADVVLLPGTQVRQVERASSHTYFTVGDSHWALQWGCGRSPFVNKSAGRTMLFRNNAVRREHITRVDSPPSRLQGRGGAVCIKKGAINLSLNLIYPSPVGNTAMGSAQRKSAWLITEWARKLQQVFTSRCTKLLGGDLNS